MFRKDGWLQAGRLLAAVLAVLAPAVAAAGDIPLTLLSNHTGVEDLDAVYDAAGRLHVCGLRDNGDVRYWRFSADGKLEHSNLAIENGLGGCAIATKQYGSVERPVIVTWAERVGTSGYEIVENHDTSGTDTPSWPGTAVSTNVYTPGAQTEASLTPPALIRYLGTGGANHQLTVAGATSAGVKLNKQSAGSTSWWAANLVETFQSGVDVKAVALTADYYGGYDRFHLAYVWNETVYPASGLHKITIHTRIEGFSTAQPYGTAVYEEYYPGRTLSLAVPEPGSRPWVGVTHRDWFLENQVQHFYAYAAVLYPAPLGDWDVMPVDTSTLDTEKGDFVEVGFLDGRPTASYVNAGDRIRVFATYHGDDASRPAGCTAGGLEASCWRRKSMLYDVADPPVGRTAFATTSATAETAAFIVAQSQAVGASYAAVPMAMTARVPHVATKLPFASPSGSITFGPPKVVGNGAAWFAVYKKWDGSNPGLVARKWDPTDFDGDVWGAEQTIVTPAVDAVADFDATFDGGTLQVAWIDPGNDWVRRREWDGVNAPSATQTVDTGVSDTGAVRIAARSGRLSFAYPKSGDVYYRERDASGTWSAAHAALNEVFFGYRVLSVGLGVDPAGGERRVVGVLSTGQMKTSVCTLGTCDAAGDWSSLTSLGAPNVTGGAWLDHRFGVAYAPDGSRVGIVGGGSTTSPAGTSRLFLHEDSGSGFAASPLQIDSGIAGLSYTASGKWADLRYDANGNFRAAHYDDTHDEVRTVRQWLPGVSTAVDVLRWAGPVGFTPEVRLGFDEAAAGYTCFGVQQNSVDDTRLYCEPTVQ